MAKSRKEIRELEYRTSDEKNKTKKIRERNNDEHSETLSILRTSLILQNTRGKVPHTGASAKTR